MVSLFVVPVDRCESASQNLGSTRDSTRKYQSVNSGHHDRWQANRSKVSI